MTAVRRRKSLAAGFLCAKEENPPVRAVLLRTGEGSYGDAAREKLCGGLAQPSSTSLDAVSSFSLMNATQPLTSPSVMTGTAVTRR